jgi:transposase
MYEADVKGGRPSIAPEKLMRAMLLQVLYSVRSERQLVEQIQYNLLFRWLVGLPGSTLNAVSSQLFCRDANEINDLAVR